MPPNISNIQQILNTFLINFLAISRRKVCGGGGGGWVCKPILVFSFDFGQAEQLNTYYEMHKVNAWNTTLFTF